LEAHAVPSNTSKRLPSHLFKVDETYSNSMDIENPKPMTVQTSTLFTERSAQEITMTNNAESDAAQSANGAPATDSDEKATPVHGPLSKPEQPVNDELILIRTQLEQLQLKIKSLENNTESVTRAGKPDNSQVVASQKPSAKFSDEPVSEIVQPDTTLPLNEEKPELSEPQIRPVPKLRLVDWTGFKNVCLEDRKVYAIEVLMGPAKFYWQRHSEKARRRQFGMDGVDRIYADGSYELTTEQLRKAQKEVPERIRVNSRHVLSILSDIMSEDLELKPTVFLRPYKPFVLYEAEIRQWLKDLEAKWGAEDVSTHDKHSEDDAASKPAKVEQGSLDPKEDGGTSKPGDTSKNVSLAAKPEEEENLSDSLEALQHLRCLVEFLNEYVTPVVERCRSPTTTKIHFRDLWYLFHPGNEVVYSQDLDSADQGNVKLFSDSETTVYQGNAGKGPQTMWKVLQVNQGRPVLGTPAVVRGGDRASEKLRPPDQKITPLKVLCYMIGFDGSKFGPIQHIFDIAPFEGEKDIATLEVVPAWILENGAALRERLRQQGLKFLACATSPHQQYAGPTLTHHPGGITCKLVKRTENIDGNVIIDFKEAKRENKEWVLSLQIPEELGGVGLETTEDFPVSFWKDAEQKHLDSLKDDLFYEDGLSDVPTMKDFIFKDKFLSSFKNELDGDQLDGNDLTDNELVLLPDRVCAFYLHKRCFVIIGLQGLRSLKARTEGWSDLKLPRGHKKMIQAQVEIHFKEKKIRDAQVNRDEEYDLVRGKGQGLIILLHGAPGVGKTSTAECVAESLQKPLYPITCGDLGVSAKEVEETLEETFTKAEAWDCILLLDEADVFLAQRTRTDLKRNAIVSGMKIIVTSRPC
jgi:hypothetical protein